MIWYLQHKDVLAQQDQFLARFSTLDVERMTTRVRAEGIRHLDTARDAWTKEQTTRETGPTLLTDYFMRLTRHG